MVGYDAEGDQLDSDKLRHCIFGGHVADYMRYMSENDEEKYKSHFSRFIKEGVNADNVSCAADGLWGGCRLQFRGGGLGALSILRNKASLIE